MVRVRARRRARARRHDGAGRAAHDHLAHRNSGDAAVSSAPIDVGALSRRLVERLNAWRPSRADDPFDDPQWRGVEHWIAEALQSAQAGDHIVFFPHSGTAGLPWHASEHLRCSTSYAAGWTDLIAFAEESRSHRASEGALGIVSINARDDSASVRAAFERSAARLTALAERTGRELTVVRDREGTARNVAAIFGASAIVKLQCHGLVTPEEYESALLVADERGLPTQDAVLACKEGERRHKFSWRDAGRVEGGPRLVLSAACSTGATVMGGLGDRVGLYAALRERGTRTLVAPAWDGVADDVLTVLDDTVERYVAGEDTLAECLRAACLAAEQRLPRWRAWAVSLEGDWR